MTEKNIDCFNKKLEEYSLIEVMELKHKLINELALQESRLTDATIAYKHDYNTAMTSTQFDEVLSVKPNVNNMKAYCELQAEANKESQMQLQDNVEHLKHQIELIDNMMWFKNQQLEFLSKIEKE